MLRSSTREARSGSLNGLGDGMEFLNTFFRRKKSVSSAIAGAQNGMFKAYGVDRPTDAQKLKATFYLCIAGMAIMNHYSGGVLRGAINNIAEEAKDITKTLQMHIGDIANDQADLTEILSDIPDTFEITGSTTVNGLAAFEALYFTKGERLIKDILGHTRGDFGISGYAAIVVSDGIFGKGKSKEHFMKLSNIFLDFTKELSEAI